MKRALVAAALSLVALPVLLILYTVLLSDALEPDPRPVSLDSIPSAFPVLGVWRDSAGAHCRAFLHVELRRRPGWSRNLSHAPVRPDEEEACARSFEAFLSTGAWPDTLDWARPAQVPIAQYEVRTLDPTTVEVWVKYGADDDAPNDGWYEVGEDASRFRNLRYLRYVGAGHGTAVLLVVAPLSLLTYLVAATVWVLRGGRKRKEAAGTPRRRRPEGRPRRW